MKKACLIPGSFDPVTNGHTAIVKKALLMFDKVYVGLLVNKEKEDDNAFMFTQEQRLCMLKSVFADWNRVEVVCYEGMTVDLAASLDAVSVRGIRNQKDIAYEISMYEYNKSLDDKFETVYFMAEKEMRNISSTMVRQKILENSDYMLYIPNKAADYIRELSVSD